MAQRTAWLDSGARDDAFGAARIARRPSKPGGLVIGLGLDQAEFLHMAESSGAMP